MNDSEKMVKLWGEADFVNRRMFLALIGARPGLQTETESWWNLTAGHELPTTEAYIQRQEPRPGTIDDVVCEGRR